MNPVHQELLQIEAALEHWRTERGFAMYGCGQAERLAFTAGYQAGLEFNAVRRLDPDEEAAALQGFRPFGQA